MFGTETVSNINAGTVEAQFDLGVMYEQRHGTQKSDAQAAVWYYKAADQGYENAKTALRSL